MNTREAMSGIGVPERTRWPFDDRWGGAAITEGSARAQALYAQQMYNAAMRGHLLQFAIDTERKSQ